MCLAPFKTDKAAAEAPARSGSLLVKATEAPASARVLAIAEPGWSVPPRDQGRAAREVEQLGDRRFMAGRLRGHDEGPLDSIGCQTPDFTLARAARLTLSVCKPAPCEQAGGCLSSTTSRNVLD